MSNFPAIETALLTNITGGGVEGSAEVTTPAGSGKGSVKVTQDPVKQYGEGNLLACKQQASDNFGGFWQSGARLDQQLADCDKQFGKQ